MEEIISILKNDADLSKYPIKPFGQLKVGDGITYDFNVTQSNGIKEVYRLSITTVAYSIGESLEIINRVKQLLLTIGDDKLTDKILKVNQNGGGSVCNVVDGKNMYHFTAIFNITRRI
nr:MAG TPA: hypothetical protein [Caudoviricetes sp.]